MTVPAGGPGLIVRVRLGAGLCYTSRKMPAAEATQLAEQVEQVVTRHNGAWGFVPFEDSTLGVVRVRAQKVVAIKVRPVTGVPS